MIKLQSVFKHRFGPLAVVVMLVCSLSFITRVVLMIKSWGNLELTTLNFIGIFFIGFLYDIVVSSFFAIPVALYCWLMKDAVYQKRWHRIPLFILFFIISFILVLNAGSEIVFWDEFSVRYNFIAVDYLIYTTEVLGNIWESYNIPLLAAGVVLAAGIILVLVRKKIIASQQVSMRFAKRSIFFFIFLFYIVLRLSKGLISDSGDSFADVRGLCG